MGLLDKIGSALKKAAEATKNFAEQQAKQMRYRNEVHRLKLQLLLRFTKDQLEQVATLYQVSLYVYPDPFAEKAVRLRSKADIARHLADKLYYNEVLDAAQRFKIRYTDIEEERQRIYEEIFGLADNGAQGNQIERNSRKKPNRSPRRTLPPNRQHKRRRMIHMSRRCGGSKNC